MKIVTLDSHQFRTWRNNAAVLVDSETGEAVLENGNPVHPTREEILGILKARKTKKLFNVERAGRQCHFVNGREFLKRTFARIHGDSVQLRNRAGQVLGMSRQKFQGHDIGRSDVPAIDGRPPRYAKVDKPIAMSVMPASESQIPSPHNCPVCGDYSKPLGCRQDEHHYVCRYHDAWEERLNAEQRRKNLERRGIVEPTEVFDPNAPDEPKPSDVISIISLDTGAPLRPATPNEIAEAMSMIERGEVPLLNIDGTEYAIGDDNLALPMPATVDGTASAQPE